MKEAKVELVKKPKFKPPKVRFNGKYYRKRMREIKRTLRI